MDKVLEFLKSLGRRLFSIIIHYPLATAATVLIVVFALAMLIFGQTFQIGGLLGKIWGKKTENNPDVRAIPPPNRVDKDGKPIIPGQADDKGWVQTPVSTEIRPPSIFDDPSTIVITHPDKGEVKVPLPTGVKSKDVASVLEVAPNVYQVATHDSGVTSEELGDLINKLK